jgi:hypothetical protein
MWLALHSIYHLLKYTSKPTSKPLFCILSGQVQLIKIISKKTQGVHEFVRKTGFFSRESQKYATIFSLYIKKSPGERSKPRGGIRKNGYKLHIHNSGEKKK